MSNPIALHHKRASHARDIPADEFAHRVCPHLAAMLRDAQHILRSHDLAWDAVQEVLVSTWERGWLSDDPGGALRALVRKKSLHLRRGMRRRRARELACPICGETDGPPSDLALERQELQRRVRRALSRLPLRHRAILVLYELEDRSYEEIARVLGIPVGTVRSRLNRARKLLRGRFATQQDTE